MGTRRGPFTRMPMPTALWRMHLNKNSMATRFTNRCCVVGCNNEQANPKFSFFTLPKDTDRRNEWLEKIGRVDLLKKKDLKCSSYKICSVHFSSSAMYKMCIRKLEPDAVPSKYLPSADGSPAPSQSQPTEEHVQEPPNVQAAVQGNATVINSPVGARQTNVPAYKNNLCAQTEIAGNMDCRSDVTEISVGGIKDLEPPDISDIDVQSDFSDSRDSWSVSTVSDTRRATTSEGVDFSDSRDSWSAITGSSDESIKDVVVPISMKDINIQTEVSDSRDSWFSASSSIKDVVVPIDMKDINIQTEISDSRDSWFSTSSSIKDVVVPISMKDINIQTDFSESRDSWFSATVKNVNGKKDVIPPINTNNMNIQTDFSDSRDSWLSTTSSIKDVVVPISMKDINIQTEVSDSRDSWFSASSSIKDVVVPIDMKDMNIQTEISDSRDSWFSTSSSIKDVVVPINMKDMNVQTEISDSRDSWYSTTSSIKDVVVPISMKDINIQTEISDSRDIWPSVIVKNVNKTKTADVLTGTSNIRKQTDSSHSKDTSHGIRVTNVEIVKPADISTITHELIRNSPWSRNIVKNIEKVKDIDALPGMKGINVQTTDRTDSQSVLQAKCFTMKDFATSHIEHTYEHGEFSDSRGSWSDVSMTNVNAILDKIDESTDQKNVNAQTDFTDSRDSWSVASVTHVDKTVDKIKKATDPNVNLQAESTNNRDSWPGLRVTNIGVLIDVDAPQDVIFPADFNEDDEEED